MKKELKSLEERKEIICKLALEQYDIGALIYKYVKEGSLDHIISKITDVKTKTIKTSFVPKGYLTGEEQFVDVLCQFITRFNHYFAPIEHKGMVIQEILASQVPKFLLCKNYVGDNNFIPYYQFNMKQCIVNNFYNNIKAIYDTYSEFFKYFGITKNMSLKNEKTVDLLFDLLHEMVWCNYDEYGIFNLFSDYETMIKENDNEEYKDALLGNSLLHWNILIKNYVDRVKSVRVILDKRVDSIITKNEWFSYYDLLGLLKMNKNPKEVYLKLCDKEVKYAFDKENGYLIVNDKDISNNHQKYLIDCFLDHNCLENNLRIK